MSCFNAKYPFYEELTIIKSKTEKQRFTVRLWQEGDWIIAQCLDVDVASQGETKHEALEHLREALALHFEPPCATIIPQVE